MRDLLYHSLSPNTRAAYNSGVKAFLEFCLQHRRFTAQQSILPTTEDTLLLFTSYLSLKVSPPTIKVYLAGVRNLHIEAGVSNPFENLRLLPRLIRGIKRIYGQERRPRLPITPQILLRFNRYLQLNYPDHIVLWSAMLIAFFGFLRSSELLDLRKNDITVLDSTTQTPTFGLRIRYSKSDPFRQSATIRLAPSGHPTLCPSKAICSLLKQPYLTADDSPLLQWASGSPVSRQTFNNAIKWLAQCSGLNPSVFSTHSFRIGAATTAASAGVPDSLIQTLGRWSSDAYQLYIRTPPSTLDHIAYSLASQIQ